VGLGFLIVDASRSHSDTPHSIGLLWTSDRPRRRNLYLTICTILTVDKHAPGGIQTSNPSTRGAADPRLRPRGHRDRLLILVGTHKMQETSTDFALNAFCRIDLTILLGLSSAFRITQHTLMTLFRKSD